MPLSEDIAVIERTDFIEELLGGFRDAIGDDYEGYRGHIYRVLSYTMHFLGGDETHRAAIETGLVYHDLGIWTDHALAYLEPSANRAESDRQHHGWSVDPELLRDIIYWHHKITPFRGPNEAVINAVRKADWIDASGGRIRKGMPKACVHKVSAAIPHAGFYDTLMRLGPELSGGNTLRMLRDGIQILKL